MTISREQYEADKAARESRLPAYKRAMARDIELPEGMTTEHLSPEEAAHLMRQSGGIR